MGAVKDFIRTTIVGGLVFVIPLVVLLVVLRHALRLAAPVAEAVAARFPAHEVAGITVASIVAVLMLVLASFLAGLFALTPPGRGMRTWLEHSLFGRLPQYRVLKSVAAGRSGTDEAQGFTPVLVSLEGGWQPGFQLEPVQAGWVAVLVPQAPSPMSGAIMYMPVDKVRPLDLRVSEAMALVKCLGAGSASALGGADLTQPRGA